MFTNNNQASLFSNSSNNANDQDMAMESKFQTRKEAFLNEENFSALKENEMTKELSLGQNMRNKIFMQKRLKKSVNSEQSQSCYHHERADQDDRRNEDEGPQRRFHRSSYEHDRRHGALYGRDRCGLRRQRNV